MENRVIEKTIEIKAPISKVWRVFADSEITKQMGGYYATDWEIGSFFGFTKTDGNIATSGILLEYQQELLIKHSLFEPNSKTVMAVLTYEFQEKDGHTFLAGREELTQPLDKAAFEDASTGWELALKAVKEIAETS